MIQTVLLVEPDSEQLGELASQLQDRGLEVWTAEGLDGALKRARGSLPECLLVSSSLGSEPDLKQRLAQVAGLIDVPRFRLVEDSSGSEFGLWALPRHDAEGIARRLHAITRSTPASLTSSDFRGDLAQLSVAEVLQVLSANRKTGSLTLQTALGAGEVRLQDGEVVDALYRRLEGQKALFRLLGEREGTFSFASGGSTSLLRRIHLPTHSLLLEGMRQFDELQRLREALDLDSDALLALRAPSFDDPEPLRILLEALNTPRTLAELLDQVGALDLEVLILLGGALEAGIVRIIPFGSQRVALADPEHLGVLAALAKRVTRPEFRGPPRVCVAASPRRLLGILAALGRINEATLPPDAVPSAPIPFVLATLGLGDGAELEVLGLPLVEAYLPLWNLLLAGCVSAAIANAIASDAFEQACSLASVPIVHALTLLGDDDDCSAQQVGALIHRLLESAAGD